jgi:hypothetical protein
MASIKHSQKSINWILSLLIAITTISAEVVAVPSTGRSFQKALVRAQQGDTLKLSNGHYLGKFIIPPGVTIIPETLHKVKLNGNGADRVVILTNGSTIEGITIVGGRVGVYSEGIDNSILQCNIHNNRQTGIVAVGNMPNISDNIIARNGGSGIQLWEINNPNIPLEHNTIVFNINHGISVGGESKVLIENNIIAYNHKLTIKSTNGSIITQKFNVYYYNAEVNMMLPEENFSFDPQFVSIDRDEFRLKSSSRCFNNGKFGSDIGSRIYNNN